MYPKACSICHGTVPAGEGIRRKEGTGWGVTHTEASPCPRGSVNRGYAQAYTRRAVLLLKPLDATMEEIQEAAGMFLALARNRWTTIETCQRTLLQATALRNRDRFVVEMLLDQLTLVEESHA